MNSTAYKVYHVRGHNYTTFHSTYGEPKDLGREILAEIPADLVEYLEWKRAMNSFYAREDKRIQRIAKEIQKQKAVKEVRYTQPATWGRNYNTKPSRTIHLKEWFFWIYIVDLDTDRFTIIKRQIELGDYSFYRRSFCLDNIPRWLWDMPLGDDEYTASPEYHPITETQLTDEYKCVSSHAPGLDDPKFLEIYASCSIRDIPRDYEPKLDSVWKSIRFLLLRQLLHRFHDTSRHFYHFQPASFFAFRQMVYAAVSLAHEENVIHFREQTRWYEDRIGYRRDATPWWEPPDAEAYWVGEVLILLDPSMGSFKNLPTMIGKAVKLSHTRGDANAILFSGSSTTILDINRTEGETVVSKSPNMELFNAGHEPCCTCCCHSSPTPGLFTLIDTLSSSSQALPTPTSYPRLPNEICEIIYNHAPTETQHLLRSSCRLFNAFSQRTYLHPQIGEWKLMKSGDCPSRFSAVSGSGTPLQEVNVKTGDMPGEIGYEVGVYTTNGVLELDMSLFHVEIATDEECCRNYPKDPPSDAENEGENDEDGFPIYRKLDAERLNVCGRVQGLKGELYRCL